MSRNIIVVTEQNRKDIEQIIPVQVGIGHVIAFGNDRALGYWADVTDPIAKMIGPIGKPMRSSTNGCPSQSRLSSTL